MFFPRINVKIGPALAPARPALLRQRRLSGAGLCVSGTISGSRIPRPMHQTDGRLYRQPHLRHGRNQRLRLSRPHHRTAPARVGLPARPAVLSRLGCNADGFAGRRSDFRTALAADRRTLAARAKAIPLRRVAACPQLSRQVRRYQTSPHLVSFLYLSRCGMMESCPSRRILSFS